MLIRKSLGVILPIFVCQSLYGQSSWRLVEETYIKGSISGTITQGYAFKVSSRSFYVVADRTRQRVRTRNPNVRIFQSGTDYKLEIDDFDEPVICKKLKDVVETQIQGTFNGWSGETLFKMLNGQIWQQASYSYLSHYAYSPSVLVYEFKGNWIMKVEDVDETVEVKKIESAETQPNDKEVIETQIDGEFKGWEGETLFKMLNGQIWQQSTYAYMYHYAYSPKVFIFKSGDSWKMKVEDVDEVIEVRKVK